MSPREFLKNRFYQGTPAWLSNFQPGDTFSRSEFFGSRTVYYPGSGTDGQPVKLFASSHSAHCFVYVDYGIRQDRLETELDHPAHGFRGYHHLARLPLQQGDLAPNGWTPHVQLHGTSSRVPQFASVASKPFAFLEVLERDANLDDSHGVQRLAILFLGGDGVASFDALYCQSINPGMLFAVVLQDHNFGGNYDKFGAGGTLEKLASTHGVNTTQLLLCADNTVPWEGYRRIAEVEGEAGGMHGQVRYLHQRTS